MRFYPGRNEVPILRAGTRDPQLGERLTLAEATGRALSASGDHWQDGAVWIAEERAAGRPSW
jgi:hypothetical protein